MARFAVAVAIVMGLAVGVWWLWPRDGSETPSTTVPLAATTVDAESTSTSTPPTTPETDHVVQTEEEAEEILRELWFGWFEGIYNQDEDRIRQVVATEEQVETAREQFGVMEFTGPPTRDALVFSEVEILRSDAECLAIWASADATAFRGPEAVGSGVWVLRNVDAEWQLTTLWTHKEDLWEPDCEALLSSSA